MLQSFLDWRRRRAARRDRAIFRYWDGTRTRAVDPMVVYRVLACHPRFIWRDHPRQVERDHDALRITLEAIREAFDVRPLTADGSKGISEGETIGLLVKFSEFLESAKKNTSSYLILPPPMVRASLMTNSEPVTKSDSDSSSTPPEPKPDTAAASFSESSPPSETLP